MRRLAWPSKHRQQAHAARRRPARRPVAGRSAARPCPVSSHRPGDAFPPPARACGTRRKMQAGRLRHGRVQRPPRRSRRSRCGCSTGGSGTATMPSSRGRSGGVAGGKEQGAGSGEPGGMPSRRGPGTPGWRVGMSWSGGRGSCVGGFVTGVTGGGACGFATGVTGGLAIGFAGVRVRGLTGGFFTGPLAGVGTTMILPQAPQRIFRPASCASTSSTWPEGQRRRRIIYSSA